MSYESTTRRMEAETVGVCALIQDMLPFYLEGDVSQQSRAFIDEHLASCGRCSSFLAGGRSLQMHLRREHTLRSSTVKHDHRAQHAIARGQRQVILIAAAATGVVALLVLSVALWFGLTYIRRPTVAYQRNAPTSVPPISSINEFGFDINAGPTPTPVPVHIPEAQAQPGILPTAISPSSADGEFVPSTIAPTTIPATAIPVMP